MNSYANDNSIKQLNQDGQETIYLFLIDDSLPFELAEMFKRYCEAFYYGVPVKLLRPGD